MGIPSNEECLPGLARLGTLTWPHRSTEEFLITAGVTIAAANNPFQVVEAPLFVDNAASALRSKYEIVTFAPVV